MMSFLKPFPERGGYTLMGVSENSRDPVGIKGPDGGITVPFQRDILRQAKLYIRPLQCDIPDEKLKALNKEAKEVNYVCLCYNLTVYNQWHSINLNEVLALSIHTLNRCQGIAVA